MKRAPLRTVLLHPPPPSLVHVHTRKPSLFGPHTPIPLLLDGVGYMERCQASILFLLRVPLVLSFSPPPQIRWIGPSLGCPKVRGDGRMTPIAGTTSSISLLSRTNNFFFPGSWCDGYRRRDDMRGIFEERWIRPGHTDASSRVPRHPLLLLLITRIVGVTRVPWWWLGMWMDGLGRRPRPVSTMGCEQFACTNSLYLGHVPPQPIPP